MYTQDIISRHCIEARKFVLVTYLPAASETPIVIIICC